MTEQRAAEEEGTRAMLGLAIEANRSRRGITKTELAELVGVDPAQVTRWVQGVQSIGIDRLFQIERALGLERGMLLIDAGLLPSDGNVALAIAAAEDLDDEQKQVLLQNYQLFSRQHRSGRSRRARQARKPH